MALLRNGKELGCLPVHNANLLDARIGGRIKYNTLITILLSETDPLGQNVEKRHGNIANQSISGCLGRKHILEFF